MKIFITGATGKIGSVVVEELKKAKIDFTSGVTKASDMDSFAKSGLKAVQIDFEDVEALAEKVKGHDLVFSVAPLCEQMRPWSLNILEASKKAGVKHIVRTSGYGGDSASDYLIIKEHGLIDEAIINSGLSYTITRPNTFMQNFVTAYGATIKDQDTIYLPNGDAKLTYVDVREVGRSVASILKDPAGHENKIYNILGRPLDTHEIAKVFSRVLGREIKYVPVSVEDTAKVMLSFGMPEWTVKAISSLDEFGMKGHTDVLSEDIKLLTGQEANTFEKFVTEFKSTWI